MYSRGQVLKGEDLGALDDLKALESILVVDVDLERRAAGLGVGVRVGG